MKRRRRDRRYDEPYYPLERVHEAVSFDQIALTRKARDEAEALFPDEPIEIAESITEIVGGLTRDEFRFSQERDGEWIDVYRVECEGCDVWLKLKLEKDPREPEMVIVISFHEWDDSREV
jgi:hypothetical protein